MPAFIINFQSPFELDDLWDRYERDGLTNIDHILNYEGTLGEWTVHKDAKPGDRVFFMCAVTSKDHMGHVCSQARKTDGIPDEIVAFAEAERELYRRYAGTIVAIGRVEEKPFQSYDSGYSNPAWRNPWYARIRDVQMLAEPIGIDKFRDFIKVSRTGSITKLDNQQETLLESLASLARPREPRQGFRPRFGKITRFAGRLENDEPTRSLLIDPRVMGELRDALESIIVPSDEGCTEPLVRAGIKPSAQEICELDVETADEDVVLAILGYALCGDEPPSDDLKLLTEEGVIDSCLYRLAEIDEDDLRERRLSKLITDLAEHVLTLLEGVPEGAEGSIDRYVALACDTDGGKDVFRGQIIDLNELFDIDFYIWRHAADHGLRLDNSEYADMMLGLPFSVPFRVYHSKTRKYKD